MKLNYDILVSVMKHLERNDLLYMMCTCRMLYGLGISLFLREIDIMTRPWADTPWLKLYRLHLLENPTRFSNVTSLTSPYAIFGDDPSGPEDHRYRAQSRLFPAQSRLPGCLQYFTCLQALKIMMDGKNIEVPFLRWILSLSDLRTLRLLEVGKQNQPLVDLLQGLRSTIEVVEISRSVGIGMEGVFDLVPALVHATSLLTSLSIVHFD